VYAGAMLLGGVVGRLPLMIAGLGWDSFPAWMGSLVGVVASVLVLTRWVAMRSDEIADTAAAMARAEPPPRLDTPRVRELARLLTELYDLSAAQDSLRARQRHLAQEQDALLDATDGGVVVLDREQRVMSINRTAEKMLSVSGRSVRGLLLQEVSRYASLHRFAADAVASDAPLSEEFQLEAPVPGGGRIGFSVRAAGRRLLDADGRPLGVLLMLTDITRLRRLEAVRTDFAANVSHELRTPITSIRGYIDTLVDSPPEDPARLHEFLSVIQRNARRLSEIVDDMLDLTNLERPDAPSELDKPATGVADVVRAAVASEEPQRAAKRVPVTVEVPEALVAPMNGRLIEQALRNLISNAIRYSPPDATIVITARPDRMADGREAVRVSVTDRGPGIAPQHLPRIFERFYRVDKARSREHGGTGLGLAIVKHIAHAHAGKAGVESSVGQGSTFWIALPV